MASQVTIASATDHSVIGYGTIPIHGGQMYLRARQVAMALGATPALLARARAAFHNAIWVYVDLCSGSGGVCRQVHFFAQAMNDVHGIELHPERLWSCDSDKCSAKF